MARKTLSKRLRFEIFKRDEFKCHYCGRGVQHGIILNIDHIIPVIAGGTNDMENLISACFDCNSGKSDKPLNKISKTAINNGVNVKDYQLQVEEYFKFIELKKNNNQKLIDLILEPINSSRDDYGELEKTSHNSVNNFLKILSVDQLIEAVSISRSKMGNRSKYTQFKYFCGICHNLIKKKKEEGING